MLTVDKIEIKRGMSVWICPFFDKHTDVSCFEESQEEFTVIDTLNNCMVYTRCGKGYPTFHSNTVFAKQENAILAKKSLIGMIISLREADLQHIVDKENEELHKIREVMYGL